MLTRATRYPGPDGQVGTEDDVHNNQTTPFIDQNQTYTSHPSHQVFLREYELRDHDGDAGTPDVPVDTGRLLDGTLPGGGTGGLATWTDVKRQAREVLGIDLVDVDVLDVPQVDVGPLRQLRPRRRTASRCCRWRTAPRSRATRAPRSPPRAPRGTNHAFLDDIAHGADARTPTTSAATTTCRSTSTSSPVTVAATRTSA